LKQLTSGGTDFHPCFSPDGKWIVYESYRNGVPMLWKISSEGGVATQLTNVYSSIPVISPDGKTVACRYFDEKTKAQTIALIGFEDGRIIKTFDISVHLWQRLRWISDGSAFSYVNVRNGVANIWSQPVAGGQPRQLTDFKSDLIFSYDWSRNGQQLACERGLETSDVVLITDYP
jgi:Tol biopolymer transport system component